MRKSSVAEASESRTQQPVASPATEISSLASKKPRSLWSDAWRTFRRHRLALLGTFVIVTLLLVTAIGPFFREMSAIDFTSSTQAPSLSHPFGTDDLGRDIMARVFWGGRVSLSVGIVAVVIAISLGTLIGAVSGFYGGFMDSALMRFTDMAISLPILPLLLLCSYLFRDSLTARFGTPLGPFILVVGLIGVLSWMPVARLVRASFLSVKEKEFIEAAYCIGASRSSIIFRHILPNTVGPVIVAATIGIGSAIITESSLSFLGLGFPPDTPTWGRLLFDGRNYMNFASWFVIFPGLAIFLSVLSINYIGDGLRDAFDPRRTM
jgi:peptide/nickel transport system permease protein